MSEKTSFKDSWVEMFRAIGLDDAAMNKWHGLFEARHPEAHQSFLEWLGIGGADIESIRQNARTD